jgi:hypothetical protein
MKLKYFISAMAAMIFPPREECHNSRTKEIDLRHAREEAANAVLSLYNQPFAPKYTGTVEHERYEEANASLFDNSNYSEALTNFAIGLPGDGNALREANEIIAPAVPAGRRFEYFAFNKAEQLEADTNDERPVGSDFKELKFTGTMVQDKLRNRGLTVTIDEDEVGHLPNWDQIYTQRIIDRIDRNTLIRNVALLSAAAVNQARTWDTSAGKDPDGDIKSDLLLGGTAGGLNGNRVVWGETAWHKRYLSHRAQDNAGGFTSAGLTPEQVASGLGVDVGYVIKSKVTSGSSFAEILGNLVLSFYAQSGQMPEDASHIKRFVGRIEGGEYRVYKYRLGAKLSRITVERYEVSRITALAGIRKSTIS